ncbi:MAG: ABC transporter ATPase [Weeksellaceae bacterium]|jgi:hypothetical protein|nr:ABC transporter ATPase [Weeksellaceae bacterium]
MNLPKNSKIIIYQSERSFTGEEITEIEQMMDEFMKRWNAHGEALTAAYALPYDRFIVIAVDESRVATSGCSLDSLNRLVKRVEAKFNFGLLNQMRVSYSTDGEIFTLPLSEFKQKVKNGEIPEHSNIFHNGVTTLEEFEENWEMPLAESWVGELLQN